MIFARQPTWTHGLQVLAVLQEWGSIWWFISFMENHSPHILLCVQICIIPDASRYPNSVSLRSAPLACPERLSASRNVVEQHERLVLRVPNCSQSCPDLVHYFRQRRSCHLRSLRSNLEPQVEDVFAIDSVADRGCLLFGTRDSPTSVPLCLVC